MFSTLLQVAAGGAIGASARYLTGVGMVRLFGLPTFPLGVITANVLGCFVMGVLASVLALRSGAHLNPFLMTGVLGGYTTFSAFALEAVTLYQRGQGGIAVTYVLASVVLSILALVAGAYTARVIA
ncbi:fluoride efflux transporter CrcB [Aliiroseovarius sp. PTFE2010]|uniref:fluoride efflux transporter CrcB n=1 Tax=Aliiroseovarius sp. PTFE2010 TaxID=3417190 RepID=UPI003CEC9841